MGRALRRSGRFLHTPERPERPTNEATRDRVLSLVEDGRLSKACQALDAAGLHDLSPEVLTTLEKKPPVGPPLAPSAAATPDPVAFSKEQVLKALAAFRAGT